MQASGLLPETTNVASARCPSTRGSSRKAFGECVLLLRLEESAEDRDHHVNRVRVRSPGNGLVEPGLDPMNRCGELAAGARQGQLQGATVRGVCCSGDQSILLEAGDEPGRMVCLADDEPTELPDRQRLELCEDRKDLGRGGRDAVWFEFGCENTIPRRCAASTA